MWIVVWGPPRTAKTTLAGWILQSLYKDWQKTLQAIVFNLSQTLFKLMNGLPEKWPTKNQLHWRVPALLWDDFGAYSNKAVTQYDEAWDHFKGGFDVLATKLAVLVATMVDPLEPTYQIQNKYTHEIEVMEKGVYKYDKVQWQQDFRGWKPRTKKIFIEQNTFDPWPKEVYLQYDEMRMELCDEVFQKIEDSISSGGLNTALKMIQAQDVVVMKMIMDRGPLHAHAFDGMDKSVRQALVRLKSRQLVVPCPMGKNYYKYDLTSLGKQVLDKVTAEASAASTATTQTEAQTSEDSVSS